jgi:hypothetical protein
VDETSGIPAFFLLDGRRLNTEALFFVYDYFPASVTLEAKYFLQMGNLLPENVLWSFLLQVRLLTLENLLLSRPKSGVVDVRITGDTFNRHRLPGDSSFQDPCDRQEQVIAADRLCFPT